MGISSNRARVNEPTLGRSVKSGPIGYGAAGSRTASEVAEAIAGHCARGLFEARKDKAGVLRALADWPILVAAGARHGIDPQVLAALGVRESAYRNVDQPDGMGRGVFQIDIGRNPRVTEAQARDVAWAADWAAARIRSNLKRMLREHPHFTKAQALQAAVAAYNIGPEDISGEPATIDEGTPGDNFGRTVRDIADCF